MWLYGNCFHSKNKAKTDNIVSEIALQRGGKFLKTYQSFRKFPKITHLILTSCLLNCCIKSVLLLHADILRALKACFYLLFQSKLYTMNISLNLFKPIIILSMKIQNAHCWVQTSFRMFLSVTTISHYWCRSKNSFNRPRRSHHWCPCGLCIGASVDIDLEVFVNRSTAPELNSGQQLEDILVLHLERGKDYFISITGNYLPSCFGSSLSTLCLLREPIQDMPLETIRELVRSCH